MRNHPSHSRVRQVKEIIHEIHKQRPRLAILGNEGTNNADPAYGLLIFSPAGRKAVLARAAPKKQKMMWEALREATDEEMEKDPTVCVIGVTPSVLAQDCHHFPNTTQRHLDSSSEGITRTSKQHRIA